MSGGFINALVHFCERADNDVVKFLSPIIDFALPPRCAGCGLIVAGDFQTCTACWQSLTFLLSHGCDLCGVPMEIEGQICAPCLMKAPAHDGVRAAVAYGDVARAIVLKLKHGRRIGLAKLIARKLARHLPSEPVLLIPVPLHRWRLWHRGFNQSALIAVELAKLSGHAISLDGLQRIKSTPMLGGLGRAARAKAVKSAFSVSVMGAQKINGSAIVLVDDVYTSGATANACARTLKDAGAASVTILCWARVLQNDVAFD